jgi:ribosomal protein S18 acetylase RimI-like enzyme
MVALRIYARHPLTKNRDEISDSWYQSRVGVCRDAKHILSLAPDSCSGVVCAYHAGKLVGFFRFGVAGSLLYACGTWVRRGYRHRGVGRQMWDLALSRKPRLKRVEVTTFSQNGSRLVSSLEARYPNIAFWHDAR